MAPTNFAERVQTTLPALETQASSTGTIQPTLDPSVPHKIYYLEEAVQEDANSRVQWDSWMSDGKQKSFYAYVFVLLLSWHPDCDDMAVAKEVDISHLPQIIDTSVTNYFKGRRSQERPFRYIWLQRRKRSHQQQQESSSTESSQSSSRKLCSSERSRRCTIHRLLCRAWSSWKGPR